MSDPDRHSFKVSALITAQDCKKLQASPAWLPSSRLFRKFAARATVCMAVCALLPCISCVTAPGDKAALLAFKSAVIQVRSQKVRKPAVLIYSEAWAVPARLHQLAYRGLDSFNLARINLPDLHCILHKLR